MITRSHSRREGMTLIELMIAVTILSIVTMLVYGAFAQTARNRERMERQGNRYHELVTVLERIARELQMAYVSAHLNPSPSSQSIRTCFVGIDRGGGDRIDFTAFSHRRLYRDAHESDQAELSYFVTTDPEDSSKRVLARRESRRVDDDPQHGGEVLVAIENVLDFQVTYLDPLSLEWVSSWDTTQGAMQPNRLPAQVKILLKVPGLREGQIPITIGTRASLPMRYGLNFATYNP